VEEGRKKGRKGQKGRSRYMEERKEGRTERTERKKQTNGGKGERMEGRKKEVHAWMNGRKEGQEGLTRRSR
jgi:hypothetical protein